MSIQHSSAPGTERGQVLVIVAIGLLAMVAMVGLVIDGGHAWGRQRETQNGANAMAKAGTTVIQHYLSGDAMTDGDVGCAVDDASDRNLVTLESAVYTDDQGSPLSPQTPVGACGAGGGIPSGAQGVVATASQEFGTFLVGVIGFDQLTTEADATAVVGTSGGICPASAGCGVLPVTFPHRAVTCDGTNRQVVIGDSDWPILDEAVDTLDASNLVVVPLCTTGPGSVGWLDFGCAPNLESMIDDPCNVYIPIPAWLHTQTGNTNSLEGNLSAYAGSQPGVAEEEDVVMQIPINDNTCVGQPADTDDTCDPLGSEGSGNGNNMYYHIPYWQGFKIDGAFTGGSDPECNQAPGNPLGGGNGGTGCMKGWFVSRSGAPGTISTGPIAPGAPVPMAVMLVN